MSIKWNIKHNFKDIKYEIGLEDAKGINKITINNIPDIIDVNKLIEILKNLGVSCSSLNNGSYEFSAKTVNLDYLKSDEFTTYAKSLRGSIMLVGPLLARYMAASIPRPGGDKIGRRRLDTHFVNLEKLGAKLDYDSKNRIYNVKTKGLEVKNYFVLIY